MGQSLIADKKWFTVNLSVVLFLFFFSLMSLFISVFFEVDNYLDDAFLWLGNGIYLAVWFFIAYRLALKKRGEISALIYSMMLGLNSLALIAIFIREMIEYAQIIISSPLRPVYLFILSQHYISLAILIIIFLCAAEATYRLYYRNKKYPN